MALKSLCILIALIVNISAYQVPDVTITVLQPHGFEVSIPDDVGVELFAFHGNINNKLASAHDAGKYSIDINSKTGNRWVYTNTDNDVTLISGNKIYYWVHVRVNGKGYDKLNQEYTV